MKKLNKLKLICITALTICLSPVYAFDDACIEFNASPNTVNPDLFKRLKDQHLIDHHSSISNMSGFELYKGNKALYTELCKTPFHHRDSLRQHGIGIHLVAGSIEQHPHIKSIMERGLTPRNHDEHGVTFADLPGVGSDGVNSPVILDLLTLTRPITEQKHGSGSLVLHEFGHAVDFFLIKTSDRRSHISDTRNFKRVSETFDWKIFIPDFEIIKPLTFTKQGQFYISNTGLHYDEEAMNTYLAYVEDHTKQTVESNTVREEIRQYHAKNYEESFAELYARWYKDDTSREEIIRRSPVAAQYLNQLDKRKLNLQVRTSDRVSSRPQRTQLSSNVIEAEIDKNVIEHKSCELGWVDISSDDLFNGNDGKTDFRNPNTKNVMNILRERGYLARTNNFKTNEMILFSFKGNLKGDQEKTGFDEVLETGMSFFSPSNTFKMTLTNGHPSSNNQIFHKEKSFRRKSLVTNSDYILKLIDKNLPSCVIK